MFSCICSPLNLHYSRWKNLELSKLVWIFIYLSLNFFLQNIQFYIHFSIFRMFQPTGYLEQDWTKVEEKVLIRWMSKWKVFKHLSYIILHSCKSSKIKLFANMFRKKKIIGCPIKESNVFNKDNVLKTYHNNKKRNFEVNLILNIKLGRKLSKFPIWSNMPIIFSRNNKTNYKIFAQSILSRRLLSLF